MTRATCQARGCGRPVLCLGRCASHDGKLRYLRSQRGVTGPVDATQVRAHLHALRARGWSWSAIADAGRTSTRLAIRVADGDMATVPRRTAATILAVPITWRPSRLPVPVEGTRRRLQALAWMGWPVRTVSGRIGRGSRVLTLTMSQPRIAAALAAAVAEVYEQLADTTGPSEHTRRRAHRLGFAPPAAWDDLDIDDPATDAHGIRGASPRRKRGAA